MGANAISKNLKTKESDKLAKDVEEFVKNKGVIKLIPNFIGKGVHRKSLSKGKPSKKGVSDD